MNKYNIFAHPLCFEIKNRRQGPKTAGYRRKPAAILNPELHNWVLYDVDTYIHYGFRLCYSCVLESGPLFLWQRIVIEHSRISFPRLY